MGHTTRARTVALLTATALAAGVPLTACGGGDGEDAGGIAARTTAASGDASSAGATLSRAGFSANCPDDSAVFERMNAAAYQVFGEFERRGPDGQPGLAYTFIGTAWAVGDRVMVTNAHVTEAFNDTARQGVQFTRSVAVQSGTGKVVRLLRAITHPDYDGAPLTSPDVGLFTTQEVLPGPLALAPRSSVLGLGDPIQIVGFPGDVDDFITSRPGDNVPQATSLRGTITARRSHDDREAVTADRLDVYQHQAPTTPGTSGSAMVHCGLVAAVNNAGTVTLVVTPDPSGQGGFTIDRQAAASNNFAVHVRHIHELLSIFRDNAIQGYELPVPAAAPPAVPSQPNTGGQGGVLTGIFAASIPDGPAAHRFVFTVAPDGTVTGTSEWTATGQFDLVGAAAGDGSFQLTDNAPERLGFRRGVYQGVIGPDGSVEGRYFEQSQEQDVFVFRGGRSG